MDRNGFIRIYQITKTLPLTSGFTQAGVYSRRQFCADLEVYRPPEPLWNPRLREAATTLCASGGQCVGLFRWTFDFARVDNLVKLLEDF